MNHYGISSASKKKEKLLTIMCVYLIHKILPNYKKKMDINIVCGGGLYMGYLRNFQRCAILLDFQKQLKKTQDANKFLTILKSRWQKGVNGH